MSVSGTDGTSLLGRCGLRPAFWGVVAGSCKLAPGLLNPVSDIEVPSLLVTFLGMGLLILAVFGIGSAVLLAASGTLLGIPLVLPSVLVWIVLCHDFHLTFE